MTVRTLHLALVICDSRCTIPSQWTKLAIRFLNCLFSSRVWDSDVSFVNKPNLCREQEELTPCLGEANPV